MNQEKRTESVKIIDFIFTPSFVKLIDKYYNEMYQEDEGTELDIYVQDILDIMDVHNTNYKQDIVMLSGILAILVKQFKNKVPELKLEK